MQEPSPTPDANASGEPPSDGGAKRRRRGRKGGGTRGSPPDILYHATVQKRAERAVTRGVLDVRGGRPVFLSRNEGQAWQVAHRMSDEPVVLYIDVSRARRGGCHFERNEKGLWQTSHVPVEHVLNLRDGFAEQLSAGGIPVWFGPEGPRVLLIKVHRRNGTTWEVAKGKLEPAETPVEAAVREVREEIGYHLDLEVVEGLGYVRYGFFTPDGSPRLKTLFMYVMRTPEQIVDFAPRGAEGIRDVGWFTPQEAARVVPHRSLRPIMRNVAQKLGDERWLAAHAGRPDQPPEPGPSPPAPPTDAVDR